MTLTSLDLFSGIGGLTFALEGFAKPLLYCDNSEAAIQVLHTLMGKRALPKAHVHNDVVTLNARMLRGKKVDLIVGGFPCVGFSPVGKREGFGNRQSGLYDEILRLVNTLKPKLVFLENVPAVLQMGMDEICHDFDKNGYDLRWCTLSAKQFGAPHVRKRWFCLALKRGVDPILVKSVQDVEICKKTWTRNEPQRMLHIHKKEHGTRAGLLGNSVVPYCVRYAFLYLLFGFREVELKPSTLAIASIDMNIAVEQKSKYGQRGFMINGKLYKVKKDNTPQLGKDYKIVLDPKIFKGEDAVSPLCSSPRILTPFRLKSWATPRHGMTSTSNVLTERSTRDLPTQLRFDRNTPNHLRSGHVNARWIEWMMGYPRDWTRTPSPTPDHTAR